MIVALMIGRKNSSGFPGKNVFKLNGKALMEYPLLAARGSKYIDAIYVSTDGDEIKSIAKTHGAKIIDRPAHLCTKEALGEHVFIHGYEYIKSQTKEPIELLVLLFCNAPTVSSDLINRGIEALEQNPTYDSAVSVSRYNMWSPLRARRENKQGLLEPFVPFHYFGDPKTLNCDRDSQGDVYFADMSVSIVRPRCLEHLDKGLLPQKWMGQKIYPLKQWGGCDVDYPWQIPQVEYWLKEHRIIP